MAVKVHPRRPDAGELYGRALVVIAAEQYTCRLVVPQSQRTHPASWASHKDHAAKALKKLAGSHLPESLRQLERAVKRAHEDAAETERGAGEVQPPDPRADTADQHSGSAAKDAPVTEADLEDPNIEDLAEPPAA